MTVHENAASLFPLPSLGSYRLLEALGAGGMSSVFRAVHVETGHEVAIKVLPRSLAKNPLLLQRFLSEARVAESLEHPNIVSLFDRGQDGGRHYLILEYVPGGDLHVRVKGRGPFEVEEALRIVRSTAEGLRYAAARGLIHRDIKPANLLMTPKGCLKIADLGLAIGLEDDDERITREGTTVGTVDYMAPEQARDSRATGIRSDIYSLGCTFYFLLTGSPPFPSDDLTERLRAHALAPPPDVRVRRPDVPIVVADIIRRMMAKRPEQRFRDYDELLLALDACMSTEPELALIAESGPGLHTIPARSESRNGKAVSPSSDLELVPEALIDLDDEPDDVPGPPDLADLAEGVREPAVPRGTERRSVAPHGSPSLVESDETPTNLAEFARERPRNEGPIHTYIAVGAGIGLALVALVYLFTLALELSAARPTPPTEYVASQEDDPRQSPTPPTPRPRPQPPAPPTQVAVKPAPPPWIEPRDESREPPAEPEIASNITALLPPEPAVPIPDGPTVGVTRLALESPKAATFGTVRAALASSARRIELTDAGPFHESGLPTIGKPKVVRARPGGRATIVFEPEDRRSGTSPWVVEGCALILERIDLVIRVSDVGEGVPAFFTLKAGQLVLRECSITVLGTTTRPWSAIRVDPPRPSTESRIVVERSLLRGAALTLLDCHSSCRILVDRSILLCGTRPAIQGRVAPGRTDWLRSIVVTRGYLVERDSESSTSPLPVRSVGSVFARLGGSEGPIDLFAAPVSFSGGANRFLGYRSDSNHDTASARGWPDSLAIEFARPEDLCALDPLVAPIALRVPSPSPWLVGRTVENLSPLAAPGLPRLFAASLPGAEPSASRPALATSSGTIVRERPTGASNQAAGADTTTRNNPNHGTSAIDLTPILQARLASRPKIVEVRLPIPGTYLLDPIALPEGIGLHLVGESRVSGPPGLSELARVIPKPGSRGTALLAVRNADLVVRNVAFESRSEGSTEPFLRIEDGHLLVERSILRREGTEPNESDLVQVLARGTKPLENRGPAGDIPTAVFADSVLTTGGTAVRAEIGRGVVRLENCGIAAGDATFALEPQAVRRDRFAADLVLDRCTVSSAREIVRLGHWAGWPLGPDRPWLISTRACVFPDLWDRTRRESVLLAVDPTTWNLGMSAWQSTGDLYQTLKFLRPLDQVDAPASRPDLNILWTEVWGRSHIRGAIGPNLRSIKPILKPVGPAWRVGEVRPSDFSLERAILSGDPIPDVGLDPRRLGLAAGPIR